MSEIPFRNRFKLYLFNFNFSLENIIFRSVFRVSTEQAKFEGKLVLRNSLPNWLINF